MVAAKQIYHKKNGEFPRNYEEIIALRGIGNYTAAAIASFAFQLPYAVLDGNVFRVLSRFFGVEIPINTTQARKYYGELAQSLLDKKNPGIYNQALMDFGAVICKPAAPLCLECAFRKKCVAFQQKKVDVLPINAKKPTLKNRFFNYLLIHYQNTYYVHKRTNKDIWENLYEFILIETKQLINDKAVNEQIRHILNPDDYTINFISGVKVQKLTHQLISGRFIHIEVQKPVSYKDYFPADKSQLNLLPFPKFVASYLKDKNVSLN
jgi:A/G-specific adenine glycosylase